MSALIGILKTAGVSLTAATVKTLWQLVAPTNQRLKVKEISVCFRGTSATETPVLVELLYQTTAGTSSALTIVKEDDAAGETLQGTALQTFSAEPTAGSVIRAWEIHPQAGVVYQLPLGEGITLGGGKKLALRCTAPQNQTATSYCRYEE